MHLSKESRAIFIFSVIFGAGMLLSGPFPTPHRSSRTRREPPTIGQLTDSVS